MTSEEIRSIRLYVYRAMMAGRTLDDCYANRTNYRDYLNEFQEGDEYKSYFGLAENEHPIPLQDFGHDNDEIDDFFREAQYIYKAQDAVGRLPHDGVSQEDEWKFQFWCLESYDWSRQDRSRRILGSLRTLLTDIYREDIHFVFELLQNAEDQDAKHVSFELLNDRLLFRHDGRLFNFKDVNSICDVARSTKQTVQEEEENTKIGKFGVGFKSVYKYTSTPQVHSGSWHFRIADLVVPKWDDIAVPIWPTERQFFPVGCSQTTFVLPFDTAEKPEATAFAEIERGLEGLDCKTLLFLRHIETIEVVLPGKRIVIERDEEKERWGLPEILPAEAKHVMLKTSL